MVVEKSPRSENPGQDGADAEEKSTIKIFQKAVLVDDDDDNNDVQVTGSESFGAVEGSMSLERIHVPLTETSFNEYSNYSISYKPYPYNTLILLELGSSSCCHIRGGVNISDKNMTKIEVLESGFCSAIRSVIRKSVSA